MLGGVLFRPILPIFARNIGATGFQVGLLTSGFMMARAFTSAGCGKIIDHGYETHRLIRIGMGITAIFSLLLYFNHGYTGLLLIRIGQGICSGLIWPSAQILVSNYSQVEVRTQAFSVYQITGRIGMILSRGLLILLLLVGTNIGLEEMARYRLTFLAAAVILTGGFFETWPIRAKTKMKVPRPAGFRIDLIFVLGFIIGSLLSLQSITILFFKEGFLLPPVEIVKILFIIDLALLGTTYLLSYLADRFGIDLVMILLLIPGIIAGLFLPLINRLIPFIILWFFIRMMIDGFIPIARSYATARGEIGANIGFLNMAMNLGAVLGPVMGGLIYDNLGGNLRISSYSILAILIIPYLFLKILRRR